MAPNVSTCNLLSVQLLYKSIFLHALLSSAIIPKLLELAENLSIYSSYSVDIVKKKSTDLRSMRIFAETVTYDKCKIN